MQTKNNKEQISIKRVNGISVIILSVATIAYTLNFRKNNISNIPSEWGAFGDYFNPFLTLISIIAFLYLSYKIAHRDDRKAKEDRNTQKLIALNDMRHESVKELARELHSFHTIINLMELGINTDNPFASTIKHLRDIQASLLLFIENNDKLFKEVYDKPNFIEINYTPLDTSITDLIKILDKSDKRGILFKQAYTTIDQKRLPQINNILGHIFSDRIEGSAQIPGFSELLDNEKKIIEDAIKSNSIKKQIMTLSNNYTIHRRKLISLLNEYILEQMTPED
jgi:hypothetical protein